MLKKIFFGLCATMISLMTNAQTLDVPDQLRGKTVTILIPYNPGGDSDALHRFMGEQVKKLTGINIVYINKAGAGTIIGSNEAASRPADGLTLFGSDGSTHVFNPAMGLANHTDPKLLQPVSVFALTPQFMYVAANSPINSVKDLVAYTKANPKINFGCNGTQVCLYQKVFFHAIGADKVNDINFKSPGEVIISLVQGDIVTFTSGATTGFVHVQSGKIKPIGVGWSETLSIYPTARPISDSVPQFRAINLQMISVPAGTPKHIIEFWNNAYRTAAQLPEVKERFNTMSIINTGYTVQQTEQFLTKELAHIKKLKEQVK